MLEKFFSRENDWCFFENVMLETKPKEMHLNLILYPGLGKTIIVVRMINELRGKVESGLITGDLQMNIDVERLRLLKRPSFKLTPCARVISRRLGSMKR
jgi:Ni2+-binding GTPase involved in maturation of urease and hydrogenase